VYAKRVADRSENAHDTFGTLRKELARRGIADGRILTALLRAGDDVVSSGVLHAVAHHAQLDALVEAVRGSEPSRSEQARLITRLLMWTACVGAMPAAVNAVIALIESNRGKEIVSDELRAHLATVHGYDGLKARGVKTRGKARAEEVVAPPPPPPSPASSPAPIVTPHVKKADAPPTLAAINETVTFAKPAGVIALGEPDFDGSEDALIDAVNARVALAFATDLDRAVTVRITGKGLTGPEADHAVGAHQWYTLKCSGEVMELRSGADARAIPWPKGKCGIEVVAIKVPKGATVADYVLMLRDESPARLPKRASLLTIPTR
jgi:hypothetical protein